MDLSMTDQERQAGRITEIQTVKIQLRKLSNKIMEMRIETVVGTDAYRLLGKAERDLDIAIDRLDDIRRDEL